MSAPQNQPQEGSATFGKFVVGCAIGCGALVLIGIIGIVVAWRYFTASHEIIAGRKFVPADSDGFIIAQVRPDDEGMQRLIFAVWVKHLEASGQPVPPEARKLQEPSPEAQEKLGKILPVQIVGAMHWDPEAEEIKWSGILSISGYWRLVRLMFTRIDQMGQKEGQAQGPAALAEVYNDVKIMKYTNPNKGTTSHIGMQENNLFTARNIEEARELIDQMSEATAKELKQVQEEMLEQVDLEQDIVVVVVNREGLIKKLRTQAEEQRKEREVPLLPSVIEPEDVVAFAMHMDVVSADVIEAKIVVRAASEADAAEMANKITQAKPKIMEKREGLEKLEISQSGTDVIVQVRQTGIEDKIDEMMQKMNNRQFDGPQPDGQVGPDPEPEKQPEPAPSP